ncbi:hypothetical protein VNO77_39246 [Canavalia gladiata]|uniref:Uncharacterized protein n=1 Tax=Canavalia gladiata TaxID=3824 RepID=A0AAN9KD27_CANGL
MLTQGEQQGSIATCITQIFQMHKAWRLQQLHPKTLAIASSTASSTLACCTLVRSPLNVVLEALHMGTATACY